MSVSLQFYVTTLLVYAATYIIAAWGLNFQFGMAGIFNLGYIVTVAAGAYVAAVLSLGSNGVVAQRYVLGASLPYPLPLLCGAFAGVVVGGAMGLVSLRKIRSDYQAVITLVMALIATDVVTSATGLFNGAYGLSGIPNPMAGLAGGSIVRERWYYVVLAALVCVVVGVLMKRLMDSPLGRVLRALKDNGNAVEAFGRNAPWLRILTFLVGGFFGGTSGALLVGFVGAWSPGAWQYGETFVLFTAIIVGGTGSFWGAALGAVLLPVMFQELPQFIPVFSGNLTLVTAVQWIVIGLLAIVFLWFRPQGALPAKTPRYGGADILGKRPTSLAGVDFVRQVLSQARNGGKARQSERGDNNRRRGAGRHE